MTLIGEPFLREGESADTAMGGTLGIIQPIKGYRFSIDPLLLANFASHGGKVQHALDLGCGGGIAGLALLNLDAAARITGVDIQHDAIDRAERSAHWNGYTSRANFVKGDLRELSPISANLAIANPPYMPLGRGRLNSDQSIALSRHEIALTVEQCCHYAQASLVEGGKFCVVFPATQENRLFKAIKEAALTLSRYRRVHGRQGEAPSLILVEGLKGNAQNLIQEEPLILHPSTDAAEGKYTKETLAILGAPSAVLS